MLIIVHICGMLAGAVIVPTAQRVTARGGTRVEFVLADAEPAVVTPAPLVIRAILTN